MRSSCVQTLNEGGNTSSESGHNIQNTVIGNLSTNDINTPGNTVFGLRKLEPIKDDSIKANLLHNKESTKPQVDHERQLKTGVDTSDSLAFYNSKFSGIKDTVGINFAGEKLIEEIEVDSVLDLSLSEQDICDPHEGK